MNVITVDRQEGDGCCTSYPRFRLVRFVLHQRSRQPRIIGPTTVNPGSTCGTQRINVNGRWGWSHRYEISFLRLRNQQDLSTPSPRCLGRLISHSQEFLPTVLRRKGILRRNRLSRGELRHEPSICKANSIKFQKCIDTHGICDHPSIIITTKLIIMVCTNQFQSYRPLHASIIGSSFTERIKI